MDSRTHERVEEWDSRPFSGGFDGLSDLAATEFSGAVSAAGTWLFMLNGRVVGVFDGDIEDFETASGTRYDAPHPSLPLLCVMEERGGDTRANYYTNETPIQEVDETLQNGSFTGYVELSENVLSGDYYAVYYGGRRMAAAYIGNAERLLTGDEAFDRAADEVGIYEVVDVDIDVTDVPEPADGDGNTKDASVTSDDITDAGSGSESDPALGTGTDGESSDIEVGIPGGDNAGSGSTDDSPSSSIEPINISGDDPTANDTDAGPDPTEDVAVDDTPTSPSDIDLTEDPTDITPNGPSAQDSDSTSAGITGGESPADPYPDSDSITSDDGSGPEGQTETNEPEQAEEAGDDAVSSAPAETASSPSQPDSTPAAVSENETATTDSTSVDSNTDADDAESTAVEVEGPTDPDLEEVEAAAEELDRHISWVEEDDEDDVTQADNEDAQSEERATTTVTTTETPSSESDDVAETDGNDLEEQFEREEQWRETRRIPSIDPDDSETETTAASPANRTASNERSSSTSNTGRGVASPSSETQSDSRAAAGTTEAAAGGSSSDGTDGQSANRTRQQKSARTGSTESTAQREQNRSSALEEKLETLREQRDALVSKAEELEAERNRLQSQNDELSATVERLRSRIQDLETELKRERERDSAAAETGSNADTRLSPQQALSGTNLFVRYASKSQATLETAHDGAADRSEVASNLRLEHHTQFDSADAVVDNQPYEDFLTSTMQYQFVDWLTETLLYEIRDTGNANGLVDLYDAIPRIDRAELDASISLADDDTEDVPDQVTFDIVAYDKMGNPLVLATLNDSREPASRELLEQLEEASSAVKANYPSLAASIAVTSSYFQPGALEVAEQATSSGFLSRGSKLSYINLSRKEGYHLCLAESRSEGFHMNVPEL
ncbi:DUF7527 domain-containing protein [Natrinema halophilum]|uniref:Transcriptional regulator n=1 Tax=Natrinema halophilum TaxID=1699371 RepID=A0A7D5KPH6_9EURY|nr:transcriptional regulator [Natrinema halophilum]QLG47377.1 transcriptional regulator [Natrinema halophilum]